jgi:RHS repeat-associated protein
MPTTNYIWDEQNYLAETDENNVVQTVYTNEPQQYGNLVSSRISGTTTYHHFDAIGSTRQLTNTAATVTDGLLYDACGNVVNRMGSTTALLLWVGQLHYYCDVELNTFAVRRRPYSPATARWTTVDALEFLDGTTLYIYAINSPILHTDPSGLVVQCKQTCLRPTTDPGANDGTSRGGQLLVTLQSLNIQRRASGVRSRMTASYYFAKNYATVARPLWHEKKAQFPVPGTYAQCCCCCDSVSWAQAVKTTLAGGNREVLDWYAKNGTDGEWVVDNAIPTSQAQRIVPCESKASGAASDGDEPGFETGVTWLFKRTVTSLKFEFETCTYCESGVEKYRPQPFFLVTYCCFTWGYELFMKNRAIYVSRWMNDKKKTAPFDKDATRIDPLKDDGAICRASTDEFNMAIENGKAVRRGKGIVDL